MHPTPLDERLLWIAEKEAWLKTLPPPPVPPDFLGLKVTPPDPRDWDALNDPQVFEHLAPGDIGPVDLLQWIKGPPLNQGGSPSCVSHTASHGQSLFQQQEEGIWRVFDAMRVHAETGPPNEGRQPDTILKYARDIGLPTVTSGARYKIEAWAYISNDALWEETIAAALAAGKPVWICFLIPSNYSWESSGSMTSGYHENLVVGRKPGWLLCENSWGANFGHNGLVWIPVAYFTQQNWQNGLCRAHIATDQRAAPQPPPPPPPPDPSGYVAEVLRLTNATRVAAGLAPLATHPALMKAAGDYAKLMGTANHYGHDGPDGSTPIQRMTAAGLPSGWSNWGENIAAGQMTPGASEAAFREMKAIQDGCIISGGEWAGITVTDNGPGGAMTDWLNSPGHRANILFPAFTHIGIGYAAVSPSQYGSYWCCDFVNLGTAPLPDPKPEPKPDPSPVAATVLSRVMGPNLPALVAAPGYELRGRGFVWPLEVLHIDPTPGPNPNPQPNPQPGALIVTLDLRRARGIVLVRALVTVGGLPVAGARVQGTAGAGALQPLTTNATGSAAWTLTGQPAQMTVSVMAALGERTGAAQGTV